MRTYKSERGLVKQKNVSLTGKQAHQNGFSYIWSLLLVAFAGIGLVIVGETYSTSLQREKEREIIFIGREFRNAIGRYYESLSAGALRQYPATLEDLLKDPRFPNDRRYLRRIYTDPMTGTAKWGTILVQGKIAGIYSLSNKATIKRTNFDSTEVTFEGKEKYSDWVFTYPADLLLSPAKNLPGTPDQKSVDPLNSATGIKQGIFPLPDIKQ